MVGDHISPRIIFSERKTVLRKIRTNDAKVITLNPNTIEIECFLLFKMNDRVELSVVRAK